MLLIARMWFNDIHRIITGILSDKKKNYALLTKSNLAKI